MWTRLVGLVPPVSFGRVAKPMPTQSHPLCRAGKIPGGSSNSRFCGRTNRRFDEFPEFGILLQGFVLTDFQAGAEIKVLEGVSAEDAMDDDAEIMAFEIDAVIADAKAMQDAASAFEFAEFFQFRGHHLLRNAAELTEDLQLQFLRHFRQFRRAGRIKNNLERSHGWSSMEAFYQDPRQESSNGDAA